MTDDLFESISQRSSAEEAPENIRIHEITDELRRCCQLYEAQRRTGEKNVSRFEIEHNTLFYETAYSFHAFTGIDGRTIMPVFVQRLVKDALPATSIEIDTYMAALGFSKMESEGRFSNQDYEVWDLFPRNVLKDLDGDIYIVDAEIKRVQ